MIKKSFVACGRSMNKRKTTEYRKSVLLTRGVLSIAHLEGNMVYLKEGIGCSYANSHCENNCAQEDNSDTHLVDDVLEAVVAVDSYLYLQLQLPANSSTAGRFAHLGLPEDFVQDQELLPLIVKRAIYHSGWTLEQERQVDNKEFVNDLLVVHCNCHRVGEKENCAQVLLQ